MMLYGGRILFLSFSQSHWHVCNRIILGVHLNFKNTFVSDAILLPFVQSQRIIHKTFGDKGFGCVIAALARFFLPWNQVDLIFGKSGQPFFGPLYFELGPDF